MSNPAILYPMIALAFWTFAILLLVPLVRVRALLRREVTPDDFRLGESAQVPAGVSLANRNLINLLETPTLFYAVCLLLHVTAGAGWLAVALAWVFVGARVAHSVIHVAYNRVTHRGAAFSVGTGALIALWVLAALHLAAAGAP